MNRTILVMLTGSARDCYWNNIRGNGTLQRPHPRNQWPINLVEAWVSVNARVRKPQTSGGYRLNARKLHKKLWWGSLGECTRNNQGPQIANCIEEISMNKLLSAVKKVLKYCFAYFKLTEIEKWLISSLQLSLTVQSASFIFFTLDTAFADRRYKGQRGHNQNNNLPCIVWMKKRCVSTNHLQGRTHSSATKGLSGGPIFQVSKGPRMQHRKWL